MIDINKTLTQVALLLHELGGTGAREKYSRAAEDVDLVLQAIEAHSASLNAAGEENAKVTELTAQVTELTRERDALDANRHRLIEIININLDERDEARAQVTLLQAQLKLSQENVASEADTVAGLTNQVRLLQAHPSERYWEGRWRDADAQVTALTEGEKK